MGDEFPELFAGGLACDIDVIGDVLRDRRVAVEPAGGQLLTFRAIDKIAEFVALTIELDISLS